LLTNDSHLSYVPILANKTDYVNKNHINYTFNYFVYRFNTD